VAVAICVAIALTPYLGGRTDLPLPR